MEESGSKTKTVTASKIAFAVFLAASAVNLFSRLTGSKILEICSKPILMALLAVTVLLMFKVAGLSRGEGHPKRRWTLVLGLVFGGIGDILLMLSGDLFFLAGMGAFLIGHILYFCTLPFPWKKGRSARFNLVSVLLLAVLIAGVTMAASCFHIQGMMGICVSVYACCFAFLIHACLVASVTEHSKYYVYAAIAFCVFAVSDGLVAIGVFTDFHIAFRGFLVMLTYIFAQSVIAFSLSAQEIKTFK